MNDDEDGICGDPDCWCTDSRERDQRRETCEGPDCWCAPVTKELKNHET